MKLRIAVILTTALLPFIAEAQETNKYLCSYGDMQRRVEISSEPGVAVPCSVHYFKDTEMPGQQQVLWSADNDPTYCSSKAMELVAKLEGWGWDCGRGDDTAIDEGETEDAETAEPEEMLGDPDEMLGDPEAAESE